MFEVIISNVNTGRVERKSFETREQANNYANRRINSGWRKPRNHRVEIYHREPPTLCTLPSPNNNTPSAA